MLKKRLNSFRYAFAGIADLVSSHPNAKIHLVAATATVAAGFFFHLNKTEWCLVALSIAAVLAAEGFNSALEYLTDLVSPNHHPLAGKAKDMAAGAVLLVAIGAAVVGLLVFLPKAAALF
ncbi:MAG: diacylglycerol kinase family protein [Saprospiraceae bacterium]|jgi:diacylglycerol kinase (ATP)|nr:diacylglycerol kinase family protein [Saprospiraceae bacterium]